MKYMLSVFCALIFSLPLYGQWQLNGVAVCDTVGRQHIAANGIISDGAGGVFIVWGDNRDDWDIYAQHVDSSGRMLWGRQGIPVCDYAGDQFAPRVTSDGEGGFVTAWHDDRTPREVYAQRVDGQGHLLWPRDGVEVIKYTQFQGVEDVVMAADSTFIIVWRDDRFFPDSSAIFIQKLSRNGKKLWPADGVRVSDDPGSPKLLPDERGGAFVFWAGGYVDGLVMQHITREGKRAWDMPGKIVSRGNSRWNYTELSVTKDSKGGAWLAWDYYTFNEAYIQRVDSAGNALWGESGILLDTGENFFWPQAFNLPGDSVVVLWSDSRYNMQIFSGTGTPKFSGSRVLTNFKGAGFFSASMDSVGNLLMFSDEIVHYNPSQYILHAQKADLNGKIFWDSSGAVVSDIRISPDNMRGYGVPDGAGGMVVVWDDDRYTNIWTDIFSQRIYADGRAGGDTTTALGIALPPIPSSFDMNVFPNPFNGRVNIGFWLERRQKIDMKVYDSSGRLVWERGGYAGRPGKNILTWDGRNSRGNGAGSGLYIVTLSGEKISEARKTLLLK